MSQRFRTQFNPDYIQDKGEINTNPSKTVPDQSISLRKLLDNHTRGVPSHAIHREAMYTDSEIPDIQDLNDVKVWRDKIHAEMQTIENVAKKEHETAKEARNKKAVETAKKEMKEAEASEKTEK